MRNYLFVGVAAAALVAPAAVSAQETTATVRGSVTSGGQPVAGAQVTVLNTATNASIQVTADDKGQFSASGLQAGGPYTVSVSAPGYQGAQVTDVQTVAAQAYDLPIELAAAAPDATAGADVVVTASRLPNARTVSQGPATVLNAAQIANVASVNRDIRDLERRDPFARLDDTPTGGRAISFAGQNARFNRFTVDGVPITDNFGLNQDGLPSRRSPIPFDAIGQFQAKVAPYDVREGNFQGGVVNLILKSGTNEFHGTGFYARSGDEFVGDHTKDTRVNVPNFKIDNYGAELSGPIIRDKLFFMVAGERLRGGRPIPEGTLDNNAGTAVPLLRQAQVDQVSAIAQNVYNYDTGGVLTDSGDKDDRVVARIDANLTDRQRLSLTFDYTNDALNLNQNTFITGVPGLGLTSNGYIQGNQLYAGVAQLNSQWTDSFSTEVRGFYKHYKRIQDPILGRGFAQFRVCTDPVSGGNLTNCDNNAIVSFGPDTSRQTNQLTTETWGGLAQARFTQNGHDLRIYAEGQGVDIFNSFLQNSAGNYYFDSIADFQNRRANSIAYGNSIIRDASGNFAYNPDDAAAKFSYVAFDAGIMDTWRVSDTFNLSYGMRYDLDYQHDNPAFSQVYTTRYQNGAVVNGQRQVIGSNTTNISGFGLFQPRLGFDWKPFQRLSIRGGGGIFGGGTPDVYVSNSFSNTGVLTNSISIQRSATGFTGATTNAATGGAILNNVDGRTIPGAANQLLSNATVSPVSPVNAIDPNFKIPSQWRATLSGEYTANLGPLGDDWVFGADFLYSKVREEVYFTDIRSQPVTTAALARTPDGRQRYFDLANGLTSTNTNTDIFLTNTKKGRSYIAVARFDKSWNFGLGINGSFTYQDVKDQAPATSSTAGSNYSNGAFSDPNNVEYGISNDQVKYFFKYGATFDHAFFGDYKTSLAIFGESRIGHPFSYTFQDNNSTGRSGVFGTTGSNSPRFLLYVPTVNDPLVQFNSTAARDQFNTLVDQLGLDKYRGRVTPRNAFHSKWFTRIDLHAEQELPTGIGKSRVSVFGDIENFTNLLNHNWGQVREYAFPYNSPVARVQCLTTAGNATPTTGAPTGTLGTTAATPCAQYRYTPVTGANFTAPLDQIYVNQSLYSIRVGARFSF